MTKMAAMPTYGKNPSNISRWIDFNEAWHVASGPKILQSDDKSGPCDDHHLFYGKVSIGSLCI